MLSFGKPIITDCDFIDEVGPTSATGGGLCCPTLPHTATVANTDTQETKVDGSFVQQTVTEHYVI